MRIANPWDETVAGDDDTGETADSAECAETPDATADGLKSGGEHADDQGSGGGEEGERGEEEGERSEDRACGEIEGKAGGGEWDAKGDGGDEIRGGGEDEGLE